jgi:hypothetical protein
LAIEKTVQGFRSGDPKLIARGLGNALTSQAAFLTNPWVGRKLRKEWRTPGSTGDPNLARMVDLMKESGMRTSLDPVYRTNMTRKLQDAWRQGDGYLKQVWRVPFALNEKWANVIMDRVVPAQKLGAFADLMKWEMEKLEKLGVRYDTQMVRDVGRKVADSIDNRMGMLPYDNLFWEKWIKDFAMMTTRSVGWNLGTWRELGGGVLDIRKAAADAFKSKGKHWELTHRMAYWPAMIGQTMLLGGIIQWAYTGTVPDGRDWFFPKTGRKDEYGRDDRVAIPSYMKDLYHYSHNFSATAAGKLHSSIWTMADMLQNRDFYNTEIANANDPMMKQAIDYTTFLVKQYTPFSWANISKQAKRGEPASSLAMSFAGFIPAPADAKKTPAEVLATKIMAGQLPKRAISQEEREHQLKRQDLERRIRMGEDWMTYARQEQQAGNLSDADITHAIDRARGVPLERSVHRMRITDLVDVYKKGNQKEKDMIREVLRERINKNPGQLERLPENKRVPLAKAVLDILKGVV